MPEIISDQDPRISYGELAVARMQLIENAALQIGGENASVETVFPLPPHVRDEAPVPTWSEQQASVARSLGQTLGYASEHNVASETTKAAALLEGGKEWKIIAEAEALIDEPGVHTIVVSGSPYRLIGDDEKAFKLKRYESQLADETDELTRIELLADYTDSLEGFNEYGSAADVARSLVANNQETILPFGYQISESNPIVKQETGQFLSVGQTAKGQNVVLMKVDRRITDAEAGKYDSQPSPMRRMELVSELMESTGDSDSSIVFMTSNAYAERQTDAYRAGLKKDLKFFVNMYGRSTLANVKDEPMLPGARLNQLPGAIRLMYEGFKQLYQETVELGSN